MYAIEPRFYGRRLTWSVGRNDAITFTGSCSEHDRRIFEPIDKSPINVQDDEHLFLLAYRSVLRELYAVATGAVKNQLGYRAKSGLGPYPEKYRLGMA